MEAGAKDDGFLGDLGAFEVDASVLDSGGRASRASAADPHSGLPNDAADATAAAGASGGGGRLPHLERIQEAFGAYDVSGVRAHTDRASTSALGANAFTRGKDVVFAGAASLETAAEEATHAVVQGAGKGPSGVGQEGDAFERHADAVASKVARGESAEGLLDAMTGGDRSVTPGAVHGVQREVAAAAPAPEATEEVAPEAPDSVQIGTPVGAITVDVPQGAEPNASFRSTAASPVDGLDIRGITVQVDNDFNAVGGAADVAVTTGPVSGQGTLDIQDGNLTGSVGVALETPIGTGQGQAELTADGLAASGNVAGADLVLSNGLAARNGALSWEVVGGQVNAGGEVQGEIPNLGTFDLGLAYQEGVLSGETTVHLRDRPLLGNAKITSGDLTGAYSNEQITVSGPLGIGIGDWASGQGDGTVDVTNRTVTGGGSATVQGVSRGDLTLNTGTIGVSVENNQWTGGEVDLDVSTKGFRGRTTGTFDPASEQLDGTVEASMEGDARDLGSVTLNGAQGRIAVEANVPTRLEEASGAVGIDIAGEERIQAGIEALDVDLATGAISGEARGATTAPVPVAGGRLQVEMPDAAASVQNSQVTEVSGQTRVEVGNAEQKTLAVDGQGTVDTAAGSVREARGTASLVRSPINLAPGFELTAATGQASVSSDTLDAAAVDAGWRSPNFEGTATGAFDAEATSVDGQASATLHTAMELGGASVESGRGEVTVRDNLPTAFAGAAAGKLGTDFAFDAPQLDVDLEGQQMSGQVAAGLQEGRTVGLGTVGELQQLNAQGQVAANDLQRVDGEMGGSFAPGGTPFLDFTATGAFRTEDKTVESAQGEVSLAAPKTLGPVTLQTVEANVQVTENAPDLQAASLGLATESFQGSMTDADLDLETQSITGQAEAQLTNAVEMGPLSLEAARGALDIDTNAPKTFAGSAAGTLGTAFAFDAQQVDVDVEAQQLDGQVQAGLQEGQEVGIASVGSLSQLNAQGQVAANALERVDGEMAGSFAPAGSAFLDFTATGAFRTEDQTVENATGEVSLAAPKTLGPVTLDAFQANVTVAENVPDLQSATVGFSTDSFQGGIENADVDLEGETVSGQANAELKQAVQFGALEVTSATGAVEVADNELGTLQGAVEGAVTVGDNQLQFEAEQVDLDLENESVSGTVTASTEDFVSLLPNRLSAKITEATGEIADNTLGRLGGAYDLKVGDGSTDKLGIAAEGSFDASTNTVLEASGETTLLDPFSALGGKLSVEEFEATGQVTNNALQAGSMVARAQMGVLEGQSTDIIVSGSFSEGDSGFDMAGEAEVDQFDIIRPNAEGRHLSGGMAGSIDTAQNTFAVEGQMDYAINESFSGQLEGAMDQELDPSFEGVLRGSADLVQATDLFAIEKTIVSMPIPPVFGASLDAELSMSVGQLSVAPEIDIGTWAPLSAGTDLPDFDTTTRARWEVGLEGALVPYLYGGIRSSVVQAAVGGFGRAALSADAGIDAEVGFSGTGGEFAGEVGLGVNLGGSVDLSAGLFAELGVLGWDVVDWRKDDLVDYTLADLFQMDWSKTFTFGDRGPGEQGGADVPATTLDTSVTQTDNGGATAEASRPSRNTEVVSDASVDGGPSIDGASALASVDRSDRTASGDDGELGGLERAMNALTAMKALYDSAGGAVLQLANFPIGTFQLIWDIFQGRLDFDQILSDAREVFATLDDLLEYVAPMLEGWFQQFWDYIKDGPPNLLAALFGDSSAFRDVINDGVTIQSAPSEMLVHLLEGALWDDMWTSGADEAACITVLQVAAQRGMIGSILTVERTRQIFEELDHVGADFRNIVVRHAPAEVLTAELGRFVGQWRLNTSEEREAMAYIEAASERGLLRSVLSQDAAEDILSGMDGSRYTRMEQILRDAGYDV